MPPDPPMVRPENEDARIWRYIDFPKYVSMLSESAIYFHRADRYHRLFEGTLPELDVRYHFDERRAQLETVLRESRIFGRSRASVLAGLKQWYEHGPRSVYLSSWHINDGENFAMWRIFGSTRQAVAVSTTIGKLRKLLASEAIFVGEVRYFDYATDRIDSPFHRAMPFMYKRKVYEYEREARAVYFQNGSDDAASASESADESGDESGDESADESGHLETVDLRELVDSVVVAPYAGKWFERAVRRVTEVFGYEFDVAPSSMEL